MSANISIVLDHTSHPGNIGASARAMMNMGLSQLSLVNPQKFPASDATARASGAVGILDNAKRFEHMDEAIADCTLIFGASARSRELTVPVVDPRQAAALILEHAQNAPVAVLFGHERNGLSNDDLLKCHYHIAIPSVENFSSLNLGAAVQVICYELRMAELAGVPPAKKEQREPLASSAEFENFFEHLTQTMIDIGFYDPAIPKRLLPRLRRLFTRVQLEKMETSILRGILTGMQHKCSELAKLVTSSQP